MAYKSKEDQKAAQVRHYQKNKAQYIERSRLSKAKQRRLVRDHIRQHLEASPCVDCGEADPIVLEFDHQRDKLFNIGNAASKHVSIKRLKAEIEKCVIRCANCHRRKTFRERQEGKFN